MGERGIVGRIGGRLSVLLVLAACGVTSIVGIPASVASASASKTAAVPNVSCAKWDISGSWAVIQSNESKISTFDFVQKNRILTGTAIGPNFRGTISGVAKPGNVVFTIAWSNHYTGHYNGAISDRSIRGKTYGKKAKATWSATGPTGCRG
jgi:hypothetical protein